MSCLASTVHVIQDDTRVLLGELLAAWSRGQLKPHVMQTYPLENALEALDAMAKRQSRWETDPDAVVH